MERGKELQLQDFYFSCLPSLRDSCNFGLLKLSHIPRFPIRANSCWLERRSAVRTGRRLKYAPCSSFGPAVPEQEIFFHSDEEANVGARDVHVQPVWVPLCVVQDSKHRCHPRERAIGFCHPAVLG